MKQIIHFILIFLGIAITSCAEEGDIFEEKFQEKTKVSTSLILDYVVQEFRLRNSPSTCFSLEYPITLSTNTGNEVTIENNEGFKKIADSFSSDFFTTDINFPITVNGKELNSVTEFRTQMVSCEIATFRLITVENNAKCFEFNYPVILIDASNKEQSIGDKQEYEQFLINQGNDYEPSIKYPIVVNSNSGTVTLKNNFDFYRIINSCDTSCNEFTLSEIIQDQDPNMGSTFKITPITQNTIENIQWFLDAELQANQTARAFDIEFTEAKEYEICAKIKFENCLSTKEVCKIVIISNAQLSECNQISLESEADVEIQGKYTFTVEGVLGNSAFKWSVDNNVDLQFDGSFFEFTFEVAGEYEICAELLSSDTDCPQGKKFCTTLNL